jgi:hypothetical protein
LSRRPLKDLPAGEGWQPVLLLLLLLLLPLRAPPHVQPVSNTASGCAVTFVMESSAEFATSIEMGSSAVCPEPAARLARLEREKADGAPSRFFCPDVRSHDPVSVRERLRIDALFSPSTSSDLVR